jgi:polyhydroxybutyrate depolymerase
MIKKQDGQPITVWKQMRIAVLFCLFATTNCLSSPRQEIKKNQMSSAEEQKLNFTMQHKGIERSFHIYVPPSPVGAAELAAKVMPAKRPAVIYIHGGGADYKSMYKDKLDETAKKFGFLLVAPNALKEDGKIMSSRWNGGKWKGGRCCGDNDDVGFISDLIDHLIKEYNVDSKRIYATGISNGGLMVNRLACELADKIAAIATVAPAALPDSCTPARPISVLNIHGTGDPCNPFDGSLPTGVCSKVDYVRMPPHETVARWKSINGCSETGLTEKMGGVTCTTYPCQKGTELKFCSVEGMGHTWPSGSQYFFKSVVGAVSHELSTDDIWIFFSKHKLP